MDGMRDGGAWLKMRWSCLNIYHPDAIEMLLLHPLIYDTCVTISKRFMHTYVHICIVHKVSKNNKHSHSFSPFLGYMGYLEKCTVTARVMHQIYRMFCPCQEDKLVL